MPDAAPPPGSSPDRATAALDDDEARTRARLASLRHELDRLIEDATLTPPDDEHDPDGATVGFERAQLTRLVRDAEERLTAIADARLRVASGAAERCAVCGEPIGAARRAARPTADRCVRCAVRPRRDRR